jgi:hypothetical protein
MTTSREEEEDWRLHNIFGTRVLCGKKVVCDAVLDGGKL